jgi:hypothetical protein
MSISRSELLVARASAITAPPSGPNPFQLKFILFKQYLSRLIYVCQFVLNSNEFII